MRTFTRIEPRARSRAHVAVRVLLLSDQPDGQSAQRLASYGCLVGVEGDLDAAVAVVLDDPIGFDLLVMDCDAFGGIAGAERLISTLIASNVRMRFMLVSRDFDVPTYPLGLRTVVSLPYSVPDAGFRRGVDHALRDRSPIPLM